MREIKAKNKTKEKLERIIYSKLSEFFRVQSPPHLERESF